MAFCSSRCREVSRPVPPSPRPRCQRMRFVPGQEPGESQAPWQAGRRPTPTRGSSLSFPVPWPLPGEQQPVGALGRAEAGTGTGRPGGAAVSSRRAGPGTHNGPCGYQEEENSPRNFLHRRLCSEAVPQGCRPGLSTSLAVDGNPLHRAGCPERSLQWPQMSLWGALGCRTWC